MSSLHLLGLQVILFSPNQFKNSSTRWLVESELLLTGAIVVELSAYLHVKRIGTSV